VTSRGVAKILDFGLAKYTPGVGEAKTASTFGTVTDDVSLTRASAVLGTLAYLSPEQVRGEGLDVRSDLFSFGAVLYEMACGAAVQGETSGVFLDSILHAEPAPPSRIRAGVPRDLDKIIGKSLERSVSDATNQPENFAPTLNGFAERLPLTPTGAVSVGQLVRKPRFAIPILLAIMALLLGGGWLVRRTAKARWAREQALAQAMQSAKITAPLKPLRLPARRNATFPAVRYW
jgi:serine/threonine protein kinase